MADELLTAGKGRFRVKKVKTRDNEGEFLYTRRGDKKVLIIIEATDENGASGPIFEHLTMNAHWRVKSLCEASKLPHLFVSSDSCLENLDKLEGATGECILGRSEATHEWPAKTVVTKYIAPKAKKQPSKIVTELFDDSIPF